MSKTPNYLRVYEDIISRIESGDLQPGDSLPSMSQLMKQHGVGNNAVRHALTLLSERGYTESHPGKAVYVKERGQP